ncbi:molybdate ABC transporter substrate-binding protein [Aggregatibacter actinomycetemcomitans]|uniref:Molybdate ABC transporter substrate-binding protein n=1 Tax=Aggregatibacter actinomycetemcomitans TaxID=714 RepID=A0A5D0EMQ1_AGGAC|nr:molybdate ABC transporter substrate-binding protein [Aggregatibacter actinomycetemcomitans]AFI86107.1 molybdate-binding protein [Aggregatibacter actinomycetemcomitans D7S-1]AMQ93200.1 molybdate-binding protein [Aggregatibacter actinomycetemcomitans]ANU82211.1 molybdate ABC transporter substrate-binding protein [Aggregatibacter actinomycetemcomitans]EKX99147.1 molybdate ABC transporter, periplasmic molybdate-binding protein [Aggregatibacter actinomycetemcomitans Y4]KND84604.1 molybdate-bindi
MSKYSKIAAGLAAAYFAFSLSAQAKVTVFAAASMTDSLKQVAADYYKMNPKEEVVFSFASSSTLAKQIEEGAPADLFISASGKWMKYLSDKDLTVKESEKLLVGNELVLISQKDSKLENVDIAKGEWINQLNNAYLSVGDPAHVPAGQYAEEALTKLNLWDKVKDKLARGKDVRAALALVERGESPLGIVYATDAKVSKEVKTVGVFPQDSYKPANYPVAILKDHNNAETQAFLKYLESPAAKKVFADYGFSVK